MNTELGRKSQFGQSGSG